MDQLLRPARALRWRLRVLRARALLLGAAGGAGAALLAAGAIVTAAAWIDLMAETPPLARMAATALAAAAGLVAAAAALVLAQRRASDGTLAGRIDVLARNGGLVRTGVDLARVPASRRADSPAVQVTVGLCALAIELAAREARAAPAAHVVPATSATRPLAAAGALAIALGLLALGWPDVARTQLVRFVDPSGDHPPYSPTHFEVSPGQVFVLFGDSLDVTVRCTGLAPERLDLLVGPSAAGPFERLPMESEDEGRWRTQIQSIERPFVYYVAAPLGRSHRFSVDVINVPRLEDIRVRITLPAYTHEPPSTGPIPAVGIRGLLGTEVEVTASSNRPLRQGSLLLEAAGAPAREVLLMPTGSQARSVRGRFTIDRQGSMALRLVDVDGIGSKGELRVPITLLTDLRPVVRIVNPPPASLATPEAIVPVVVEAEDDFGLARVELYRSLNRSRDLAAQLPLPREEVRGARLIEGLDLSAYGLEPGDVITLFARAVDNEPGHPKGSETPLVTVTIVSEAQLAALRQAKETLEHIERMYRQGERILENARETLALERAQLAKALAAGDARRAQEIQGELVKAGEALAREVAGLQRQLGLPMRIDLEKALRPELAELARLLAGASMRAQAMGTGKASEALRSLDEVLADLARGGASFGRDVSQSLDQLDVAYPLMEDAQRFVQLTGIQTDLARRIAGLKDKDARDDPDARARMRDLADEQRRVHEALETLLDDIRERAERLPEGPDTDRLRGEAMEFVRAAGQGPILLLMDSAAAALERAEGSTAAAAAARAAEAMDKLIAHSRSMSGASRQCLHFQPTISQAMGNSLEQLLSLRGIGGSSIDGYSMSDPSSRIGLFGSGPDEQQQEQESEGSQGRTSGRSGTRQSPPLVRLGDPMQPGQHGPTFGGVPVRELPAQYLEQIRAYMERLAEELSGGER